MGFQRLPVGKTVRLTATLLLGAVLTAVFLGTGADPTAEASEYLERRTAGRCLCHTGKSTWAYLRSPLVAPEDASQCGYERSGGNCGKRPRPKGHSATCWGSGKVDCFWKRHQWAHGLACSACATDEACEACDSLPGAPDEATRAWLKERIEAESGPLGKNLVIVRSPHFYVVTNLHKKVKVVTRRGTKRLMTAHEVAHLTAGRCERAYDDFVHHFGDPLVHSRPTAVFVVQTKRQDNAIGDRYFGGPGIHMNYSAGQISRISDGTCDNGFVVNAQEVTKDRDIHGFCRHQIGHILFSCWHVANGFEDRCPRWAWCGAAHFLQKLPPLQADYATYCFGEADGGIGPMARWPKAVLGMAKRGPQPIERLFGRTSLSDMRYEDHLLSWSFMDLALREDPKRWVAMLTDLRAGREEAPAFNTHLGIGPTAFQERWVARVLGERDSLAPTAEELPLPAGARDLREALATSDDPDLIAARIKGVERVDDASFLPVVLPYLAHEHALVRESVHGLLAKTTSPAVRTALREQGLGSRTALVRAGVARAFMEIKDPEARFALEQCLADKHWLVRANAASALQWLADRRARIPLFAALTESDPRAWIAVADAAAWFPGRSDDATVHLVERLDHKLWQVRLTAARALRRIGTERAIEALIDRFRTEDGRLKAELYGALIGVCGHDAGPSPDLWDAWWKKTREEHGGLPPRPVELAPNLEDRYTPPEPPTDDVPRHYGKRFFSRSVCFVLDTSGSMELNMELAAGEAAKLGEGVPDKGTRMDIAQAALLATLDSLDPRTRIRIVFFNERVRLWKERMVSASAGTVKQAKAAVQKRQPDGETNFFGALAAALGHHRKSTLEPRLEAMPDTVFFITDGRPTRGTITAMPELLSWMRNINRFAKVRLHVVALGNLGVDLDQLSKLADAAGGTLTAVREK